EHAQVKVGLHLVGVLAWFWYFRGYVSEALRWCEAFLGEATARTAERAEALFTAGALSWVVGDYVTAYTHLGESVEIWREATEKRGLAYSLTLFGLVSELQGDHV